MKYVLMIKELLYYFSIMEGCIWISTEREIIFYLLYKFIYNYKFIK